MEKKLLTLLSILFCITLPLSGMAKGKKNQKNDSSKIEQEIFQQAHGEACGALKTGRLSVLDPLVGDTACHVRALELAIIYKKDLAGMQLSKEDSEYITLCHLLTKTKSRVREPGLLLTAAEKTNVKGLGNVTVAHGDRIVRRMQKMLSEVSVKKLQDESCALGDDELAKALKITKIDNETYKRLHMPAYPTLKAVLFASLRNQIPLAIKLDRYESDSSINRAILLYKPAQSTFILSHADTFDTGSPILIFEAMSSAQGAKISAPQMTHAEREMNELSQLRFDQFIASFGRLNIMSTILKCIANHPQFVGKDLAGIDISFDNKLSKLKKEMEMMRFDAQFGFMRNQTGGPYTCVVNHVHASTISEMLLDKNLAERYKIRRAIRDSLNIIKTEDQDSIIEYLYGLKA